MRAERSADSGTEFVGGKNGEKHQEIEARTRVYVFACFLNVRATLLERKILPVLSYASRLKLN